MTLFGKAGYTDLQSISGNKRQVTLQGTLLVGLYELKTMFEMHKEEELQYLNADDKTQHLHNCFFRR